MVNYSASAVTILAFISISLSTAAIQVDQDLRYNDEQQRLRTLHVGGGFDENSHFVTDTVTECQEVIEGNPPTSCVNVCVEVTSITDGGKLIEKRSKVSQRKCASTNDDEETTELSTGSGSDSNPSSHYRVYGNAPNAIGYSSTKASKISPSRGGGVGSGKSTKFQAHVGITQSIAGDVSSKATKAGPSSFKGVGSQSSAAGISNGKSSKSKVVAVATAGGVGSGKGSKIEVVGAQNVATSNGGPASHKVGYYKDDIETVRSLIIKLVKDSDRELIPKFLRLGFHDCVGGCDGCVNLSNADNKGLEEPINAIYPIVDRFKGRLSRADIWAMATLVSADLSLVKDRPAGLRFPMRYVGRKDCEGANAKGMGGPDFTLPSSHVTTHELLDFFRERFDFDTEETVIIMGVHAVATFHREISGFGVKDEEFGWVFNAEDYVLDNRYYKMLVGDDDPVTSAPLWQGEIVHNENGIPSRYQWFHEKNGEDERPVMTSADIALVRDLSNFMHDKNGVEGIVECAFKKEAGSGRTSNSYTRQPSVQNKPVCPVASETMEFMIEYKNDNQSWLIDFEIVLEKMLTNGYRRRSH